MNIFTFTGNLGSDAEVKYLPSGTAVCSFSVAVKSGYGDKEKTTWVKCGLFGKRAEGQLPQYLVKGAQVAVSGEAFLDQWQSQDGKHGAAVKVNIDKLDLIGGKPKSGAPPEAQQYNQPQQAPQCQQAHMQAQPQQVAPPSFDSFDDDIPF